MLSVIACVVSVIARVSRFLCASYSPTNPIHYSLLLLSAGGVPHLLQASFLVGRAAVPREKAMPAGKWKAVPAELGSANVVVRAALRSMSALVVWRAIPETAGLCRFAMRIMSAIPW